MRGHLPAAVSVALLVLGPLPCCAQVVTVSGRVTSDGGVPVGGANIAFVELPGRTSTRVDGTYTITVGGGRTHRQILTLVVRHSEYFPASRTIRFQSGPLEVSFVLKPNPLHRNDKVATGVADITSANQLSFVVGRVDESDLQDPPGMTAITSLQGRLPGVRVITGNGDDGIGPATRLRSATAISGSSDPLLIVDGTITRGTVADIAGEDVERIEVVKGAAGSAIYGSDAASGVIQVFTKRGARVAENQLRVTVRNEIGASSLGRRLPQSCAHAFQVDASGDFVRNAQGARIPDTSDVASHPYLVCRNHQDDVLGSGIFYANYFSVGGRKEKTNFNASFQNTNSEGILALLAGFGRRNFRANVDHRLTDRLELSGSAFYGNSTDHEGEQGPGSPLFTALSVEPSVDLFAKNPDGSPYRALIPDRMANASNPLYELANRQITAERTRFIASASVRWRPLNWLTAEGSYNHEHESDDLTDLTPQGYLSAIGTPSAGFTRLSAFDGSGNNGSASLTSRVTLGEVTNTTKASYISETRSARAEVVEETGAHGIGTMTTQSSSSEFNVRSAFIASTFVVRDRYIVDGLIRRDKSTLFIGDGGNQTFFRASGAWRLNEDLQLPGVDEWRVRAAYGTAGLRPSFHSLDDALLSGVGGTTTKSPRSGEFEAGTNLEFGHGRWALEYTFSRKTTENQRYAGTVSTPVGFIPTLVNAGTLEGTTHELALGVRLLNRPRTEWTLSITGDRTRQKITAWSLPKQLVSVGGGQADAFLLAANEPLGVMYGNRLVRSINDLYDDPAKRAQSGPGGQWSPDSVIVNEEGYVVRRSAYHRRGVGVANPERPVLYVDATGNSLVKIGDANPDFNLSFATQVGINRFHLSGVVDWSQGGNIYNGTRQWTFFEARDAIYDQRGKPDAAQKSQTYYATFYNGLNAIDFFVESGTYVKLKELSIDYTFSHAALRHIGLGKLTMVRLGLVGRNLATFTKYSGYDPEVSGVAGNPFQFRFDGFTYPHFRTVSGTVSIEF